MSNEKPKQEKPKIDREALAVQQEIKDKAVKTNQIVKK
jgi:hypothetical protein